MKTRTTLTIDKKRLERIIQISKGSGASVSKIVNFLLRKSDKIIDKLHTKYSGEEGFEEDHKKEGGDDE